jgi:hypothetical protein
LAVPLACAGCGSDRVATFPVTGTIAFEDGKPVPYGMVEFRNEQSGMSARANLDSTGRFTLGTYLVDDGAPEGKYRIVVIQHFTAPPPDVRVRMQDEHAAHDPNADVRVAPEVSEMSTTPLRAEVSANSKNHFEFVVPRHPPKRRTRIRTAESSGGSAATMP